MERKKEKVYIIMMTHHRLALLLLLLQQHELLPLTAVNAAPSMVEGDCGGTSQDDASVFHGSPCRLRIRARW